MIAGKAFGAATLAGLALVGCATDVLPTGDVLSCGAGTRDCDGVCVVVEQDPANCGACSHRCAPSEVCSQGSCGLDCVGGSTRCGSSCVELKYDPANCGACGHPCGVGLYCALGVCTTPGSCPPGTMACSGGCADLTTDARNCGSCGHVCPDNGGCVGGVCQMGGACMNGEISCNGVCVDTTSDPQNCGGCGVTCPMGAPCAQSICGALSSIQILPYEVVDAQYSRALDRIIIAATGTSAVHIYDPIAPNDVSIALPTPPECIAVSPDGTKDAVGHNAWVSYIDLQKKTIIKTIAVSADVSHISVGSHFAYGIPRTDQWVNYTLVDLDKLSEIPMGQFGQIYAGSVIRLNSDETTFYIADPGLEPETITSYHLSQGMATRGEESPFGMYSPGPNIWVSDDSMRIFGAGGSVYRLSPDPKTDLTYNGSFSNDTYVQWADNSTMAGMVAVIPGVGFQGQPGIDAEFHLYDYQFLGFQSATKLPEFPAGKGTVTSHGRYVFYNTDGKKIFVILQADAKGGVLHDFGVTVF